MLIYNLRHGLCPYIYGGICMENNPSEMWEFYLCPIAGSMNPPCPYRERHEAFPKKIASNRPVFYRTLERKLSTKDYLILKKTLK
jgi:hypothetical protein